MTFKVLHYIASLFVCDFLYSCAVEIYDCFGHSISEWKFLVALSELPARAVRPTASVSLVK